ncbi:MAG TPA: trypsin-like peptidase domain-containing protein [Candidatus Binatia bacterium]|nr:trypsin-like peptidase domain-containing protein [Candidatus Binatia bacterium]
MRSLLVASLLFVMARPAAHAETSRRSPVVEAVERLAPAVVNISTSQVIERDVAPFPFSSDPSFDQFFRDFFEPRRQRLTRSSLGSGVIIRGDGTILTNQHVVLRSARITVTLSDEREFEARLVGSDADSDLAVLRVESDRPLPAVEMGTSSDLMIGETVIAIGNPFGLSHTVTTGVISAVGRSLRAEDQTFYDLIQIDASINPGNSGGPLLNVDGELIGINSAIYQNAQGIGFAIPIDRAKRVVADLLSYGEVQSAWVGVRLQDLTPDLAAHFGVGPGAGVLVRDVEADSPASRAGIERRDVILAMNDHPVHSVDQWDSVLRDRPVGDSIRVSALRGDSRLSFVVRTLRFPDERADALAWEGLGLRVSDRGKALTVKAVRQQSPAASVGIRPGDVVAALNGRSVETLEQFRRRLASLRSARRMLVSIQRGARLYHVPLPLDPGG